MIVDVEFSMPLKGSGNKTTSKRRSGEVDSDNVLESTQGLPSNDNDEDLEVEDDGTEEILEKLGAEASDIKKLIQSEVRVRSIRQRQSTQTVLFLYSTSTKNIIKCSSPLNPEFNDKHGFSAPKEQI